MDYRKLALSVLLAGSLVGGIGCGGDDSTSGDAGPTGDMCATGTSHFYVLNVLNIGQADPAGDPNVVPGFNLDGVVSNGTDAESCNQVDYTSPDGTPGVDNQLGPILGSLGGSIDLPGTIKMNISDGTLLILAKLDNVDDVSNDSCVTLTLLLGQLQPGMTAMLDGDGLLTPGQTFDVKDSSYMMGTMMPLIQVQGSIVAGKLTAGPVELNLSLPVMGNSLSLAIHGAQVSADVTADTLTNGVIGGALNVDEVVMTVAAFMPGLEMTVRSVLEGQADLGYDASTMTCNQVSVGLTFSAVSAMMGNVVMSTSGTDAGMPPADAGTSDAGTPPSDGGSADAGVAADAG